MSQINNAVWLLRITLRGNVACNNQRQVRQTYRQTRTHAHIL